MLSRLLCNVAGLALAAAWPLTALPIAAPADRPQLVQPSGAHALMVDGAPFLVLGAQVHNSGNYPEALPVQPTLLKVRMGRG